MKFIKSLFIIFGIIFLCMPVYAGEWNPDLSGMGDIDVPDVPPPTRVDDGSDYSNNSDRESEYNRDYYAKQKAEQRRRRALEKERIKKMKEQEALLKKQQKEKEASRRRREKLQKKADKEFKKNKAEIVKMMDLKKEIYKIKPSSAQKSRDRHINKNYKKEIFNPNMDMKSRSEITLNLPVDSRETVYLNKTGIKPMPTKKKLWDIGIGSSLRDIISDIQARQAEILVIAETNDAIKKTFNMDISSGVDNLLGVTKIIMAAKKDLSSGISETIDFIVGKIPIPQASFAVEGGRIYSKMAFHLETKFMKDAMAATGGTFDEKTFWNSFIGEMNTSQKSFIKWIKFYDEEN